MPANTFGELFRVTTFGESHGGVVGVVIDGCPPGLELSEADVQPELDRRRPGQSELTTPRQETDTIEIQSGTFAGKTTGTPIVMVARNRDARPEDYQPLEATYRPSHADYVYEAKYGIRDHRGGGRSSARETLARVAAGAVAQKYLRERWGVEVVNFVEQVEKVSIGTLAEPVTRSLVDAQTVRCPDAVIAAQMESTIRDARKAGDSVGGVIQGHIYGVPAGLGEPVFDKLPALLGHAMLSINAVKGFEIGDGFEAATRRGSQNNDPFTTDDQGRIRTSTNRAGGTQGGISNGETIRFRVAFKPVSTIRVAQATVTRSGEATTLEAAGRHDPCVLPRAVPIVDAMAALVIVDLVLRHRAQNGESRV